MAMQPEIGSSEASDDDSNVDSVSITSTVLSEQKDVYPLEAILAEQKFQGVTKYLVKWEGYPEYRCTWETRAMFQDGEDSTFHEWETQKMRVSRGLSKPFDVPAFKNRVEIWLEDIRKRKIRRRAKRQRMGLPVGPIEIESGEDSSDSQAEEEDEEPTAVRRRSSLKRRASQITKSSDGAPESDAMDTTSSEEISLRHQWTSREEGALMDGLRVCKGPDWAQILSIHSQKLEGFSTGDLESRARRIVASFHESGKDIPQELRDVADKPSTSKKRIRDEVQKQKGVSRDQSGVDKHDRGSETDDSLVEELRIKNEAKLRKVRQKSDADKKVKSAEQSSTKTSTAGRHNESATLKSQDARMAKDKSTEQVNVPREGSHNESATMKPQDAQMAKDNSKEQVNVPRKGSHSEPAKSKPQDTQKAKDSSKKETTKSLGRIPLSNVLPKMKRRPSTVDQGAPKATMTATQLKATQVPSASRPGPVGLKAPVVGVSKAGPNRPPSKPGSQLGAVGRGPRRAPTSNMFLPKKRRGYATGADVLANWDTGKTHGNSSLAVKSLKVAEKSEKPEKPEKRYNKHSIARRAVKKGRTEPAPNIEDLQLIDPKDGKAVKASIATPTPTTGKSAYELILERREQENQKSIDELFDAEPDDMAWMGTVEEELAVTSKVTPEAEAPTAKPMTDLRSELDIRTTSDGQPTKKPSLSLQAYSQKLEARAAPDHMSAAPEIEPPPDNTAIDDLSTLKLTDSKSDDLLSAVLPVESNSLGLPNPSVSPEAPSAPKRFSSSGFQPLPQGSTFQTTQPHPPRPNSLPMQLPMREATPLVTEAIMSPEQPSTVTVPPAPRALMMSGPPLTAGALSAAHAQIAPEIVQFLFTHDPYDVYGDILVGPERSSQGTVRFRGFSKESRLRLIANKIGPKDNPFWLSSVCTAADYESRFHTGISDELFASGQIVPYTTNLTSVNDISETLRLNVSGAIYLGDQFTMVVFPIGSEDWAFLEQHMPAVPPVGLRCIIRSPIQHALTDDRHGTVGLMKERQSGKGQEITLEAEESAINVIMRNLYGIDYPRLIRQSNQGKDQTGHVFYLIFPKERRDEQDLIVHFLNANGAVEVYSYDENINDGGWEYFYRNVTNNGVIIAHSTFWRFHHMPHFAKSIWYNNLVWGLGLRKSERLSHSHLVPLFPHGCMLLITDSLLLLQPLEAVKILMWYRLRIMDERQKSWKIVMRPNIRRFLINCCRERKLDEEGRHFVQIYEQIAYMLDPEDLYDWEENEPKEEAPIFCMRKIKRFNTKVGRRVDYNKDLDHAAIARNDEVLTDFFAGWANVHMQDYRRFLIISGFGNEDGKTQRDRWMEKWTYCEAFTPTHFYRRHGVPSQEDLDKETLKRHSSITAMLRSREVDIDANAKAEEADSREQIALMEKDWKAQLDRNPTLREVYEGFVKSGVVEELQLSEDEMAKEAVDADDEWSNDGSSVPSLEMGEINGDEDQDMVDVEGGESSEVESWGLSDGGGSESSGSDSE